ncbi:MAG: hypothetical protein IT364_16600 [Candidatus Hydrogenedentes bacterium]|nr:hypothetical protein [Candidatus Hydrogenedentota bacterium]
MRYPVVSESKRPYRLWDANAKCALRWRYYSNPKRAHMGALIEARWAKVGTVVEVYNAENGRLLGQYRRTATTIEFTQGD